MKLAITARDISKSTLTFTRQMGIRYLKLDGKLFTDNGRGAFDLGKLKKAKEMLKKEGLEIAAVLLPQEKYSQFWNVKLGKLQRDKDAKGL